MMLSRYVIGWPCGAGTDHLGDDVGPARFSVPPSTCSCSVQQEAPEEAVGTLQNSRELLPQA